MIFGVPEGSGLRHPGSAATLRSMLWHFMRSALHRCRWGILALGFWLVLAAGAEETAAPSRVVSLAPSLTAILMALDAESALVGVDDVSSRQQPALSALPKVGGLFSPSLEAVVALEPDLVVLVPAAEQRDLRRRLEALGIPVEVFRNVRFEQVLENIERMGALVHREHQAKARVAEIRRVRNELQAAAVGRVRPRVVVVLQKDPLFVVGRGSFVAEMLDVVGAENVAEAFEEAYPRVNLEWLLKAAPEILIDVEPAAGHPMQFWSRWSTLPAVSRGRVLRLEPELISLPGPDLDRGMQALALAIFGPGGSSGGSAFKAVRAP